MEGRWLWLHRLVVVQNGGRDKIGSNRLILRERRSERSWCGKNGAKQVEASAQIDLFQEALDLILKELLRLDDPEFDYSMCGCRLRNSCGLPCACVLSTYFNSGEYIPVDSIDIFWRALNVSWSEPVENEDIQCDDILHLFNEKFNEHPDVPYISTSSLQDVKPDGNCGFRSVALGLGLPEDHWPRIRSDLVHELESRQEQYMCKFGTLGYNRIYSIVRFVGQWMEMPDTGLVIASTYNKVVVNLSDDGGCATSFPLWSSPPHNY
ncbi:hypothetical protein Tco_0857700 [Tanacetum coccineum]|uniref:OTU domain-containing protein n=1 Tax=Tanacetum coccineum TaxID=301880 RepID=A0ABQ5B820_9ASTR